MCFVFLPFPTKLGADHLRDDGVRAAAITNGLTMTAASICFASLRVLRRDRTPA
jgi:hypothetical protein